MKGNCAHRTRADAAAPRHAGRLVTTLALAILAIGAPLSAEDHVYYANGQAYPLIRSNTEFGVRLQVGEPGAQARDTARRHGLGALERLEGASSDSRYRVLRVTTGGAETRAAARELPGVEWVRPIYRLAGVDAPLLSSGEIVARLVPGLTAAQATALFDEYGVAADHQVEGLVDTWILRPLDGEGADEVTAAAELHRDPRTVYAHPNFVLRARSRQIVPQDEFFNKQWHLSNTGQDGATPGADIGVLTAWETTLGEDVLIGMLDDGCDVDHEDLRNNYVNVAQDIVDGDDDPRPSQFDDQHGTAVMGLICAEANSTGVRGVAPNARFTVTRGVGFTTAAETASAFTFARQQEVDVHNNSWGYDCGVPAPSVVTDAIQTSVEEGRPYEDDEGETQYRGMVILFATGNEGLECPLDLSATPGVIAVGASNASDSRAPYSNWGSHLDILAPSNNACPEEDPACGAVALPSIVTTDNTDDAGYPEAGYNEGGFDDFGEPNLSDPNYTDDFGGTSAASPIAAGVAALILSTNPELTATQVRVVLEHTAVPVAPDDAGYRKVTSRSDTYGYGRIDAAAAVQAALQSTTNGNLTWPDRVSGVRVIGDDLLAWNNGSEANSVIVVQSDVADFEWLPDEGAEYRQGQVLGDVQVVHAATVGDEDDDSYEFTPPAAGIVYFGIFTQNNVGRWSWGVAVDSNGVVTDPGPVDVVDDDGGDEIPVNEVPSLSIDVSPRSGQSPLTVRFQGNALTDSEVVAAQWDFGDGSAPVDTRSTTHTYTVTDGTNKRYVATFTVEDADGDVGERSIAIDVAADGGGSDTGDGSSSGSVEITAKDAAGVELETMEGFAPFSVVLTINTEDLPGVFHDVSWDLGDGTSADTITVLHTYTTPGTYGAQATVTMCHATKGCQTTSNPGGTTWRFTSPVEFLTVRSSGLAPEDGGEDEQAGVDSTQRLSTGGDASGGICGLGVLPAILITLVGMVGLRLRPRD